MFITHSYIIGTVHAWYCCSDLPSISSYYITSFLDQGREEFPLRSSADVSDKVVIETCISTALVSNPIRSAVSRSWYHTTLSPPSYTCQSSNCIELSPDAYYCRLNDSILARCLLRFADGENIFPDRYYADKRQYYGHLLFCTTARTIALQGSDS